MVTEDSVDFRRAMRAEQRLLLRFDMRKTSKARRQKISEGMTNDPILPGRNAGVAQAQPIANAFSTASRVSVGAKVSMKL